MYGTLCRVVGGDEVHNSSSGGVGGHSVQVGTVHGDLSVASGSADELAQIAEHLAGEVRALSARELRQWGIRDRDALPVRWHTDEELSDHPEKIQVSGALVSLAGQFTEIRTTYEAVESKRLAILGRAGSGKTVLAHRLILDLLGSSAAGRIGRVPVLFSLSDWDPATELSGWLAGQLARDFPFLDVQDSATGKRRADLFVERGLVLPVLDGFDEIAKGNHSAAIGRISSLDLPLIVTSRPGEYSEAARRIRAVSGAAAVRLDDLTRDEARSYLRQSTSKPRASAWDAVFEHLRTAPEESASRNLTAVLTTPLMVTMARTVYNDTPDHDPGELLDVRRFPTAAELQDHLLGAYLETLYTRRDSRPRSTRRPNWNPEQARRWLGHLATHLQDRSTHDLTWWQLPTTLHRRTRVLITAAIIAPVYGLANGLDEGLPHGLANGLGHGLVFLLVGFALGFAVGLVDERGFSSGRTGWEPERLRLGLRRRNRERRFRLRYPRKSRLGLGVGLAVGLVLGLMSGGASILAEELAYVLWMFFPGGTWARTADGSGTVLVSGFVSGLLSGLMIGLMNVVLSFLGDAHDPHATNPWTLLERDRRVTLVRMATVIAIAAYPVYVLGFPDWLFPAIFILRLSAWGSWLLFARLWLPLTRRLPWRPKRFLEDAHDRGVLRRAGAAYQFRHARLRDHLARHRTRDGAVRGQR